LSLSCQLVLQYIGGQLVSLFCKGSTYTAACSSCIVSKQAASLVPKVREGTKSTRRLQIIYMDLTGPEAVVSASGNHYILNIIDDFSSMPWTMALKLKSDAFAAVKAWELRVSKECGESVGIIRSGFDGEINSMAFNEWCKSRGIVHQYAAPYVSAQMGRVERLHRTLMNKARAMRIHTDLPPNRWDKFMLTASYLTARTPSRAIAGKTPFELWFLRKPDLSHLREIGCKAFVLIPGDVPKINPRSVECIMIGYAQDAKAYRCYHRSSHKVFVSFNVSFIESFQAAPRTLHPGHTVDIPAVVSPSDVDPSSIKVTPTPTVSTRPTVEDVPDVDDAPTASGPRRSARETKPSEKKVSAESLSFESAVQQAVAASAEAAKRKRLSKEAKKSRRLNVISGRTACADAMSAALDPSIGSEEEEEIFELFDILNLAMEEANVQVECEDEPTTFKEASLSPDAAEWMKAMSEEMTSQINMDVFRLVPRSSVPSNRKVLRSKWVYKLKRDADGTPVCYKARVVVKGFEQVFGQDYVHTTSPTARMESLRVLLHICAARDWDIRQIDVKTAFLYGVLGEEETQYMEQPQGFAEAGKEDWVWELRRGLYGMKQSGRIWNQTMHAQMVLWGFKRLGTDNCLYYRRDTRGTVLCAVHVDDFICGASSASANSLFLDEVEKVWKISDLGEASFCVGIQIRRDCSSRKVFLSQTSLIDRVVKDFGRASDHPPSTPMDADIKLSKPLPTDVLTEEESQRLAKLPYRSAVGSLMYVSIGTRPDIAFAVNKLAQYLMCYREEHWEAVLRVIAYLRATRHFTLALGGPAEAILGFTDSSFADDRDSLHSSMGYCFTLGSGVISWSSRKQCSIALSSTEAEYVAASEATRELLWLRMLAEEIESLSEGPTPLLCDNNGAMALAHDPGFHARCKHIDYRYHHVREVIAREAMSISRVASKDNLADIFTKPLVRGDFIRLRGFLGLV
jgi:hypothetical protein